MAKRKGTSSRGDSVPARVTQAELARTCGVSRTTVSRILGNDPTFSVTRRVRSKVLRTAKRLNHVPNRTAAALRSGRGYQVCLVFPFKASLRHSLFDPFSSEVLRGLDAALTEANYELTLVALESGTVNEFEQAVLRQAHFAGVVFLRNAPGADFMKALGDYRRAYVLVDHMGLRPDYAAPMVYHDGSKAFEWLTARLIAKGHRRIAFIGHSSFTPERLEGHLRCLDRRGLTRATFLSDAPSGDRLVQRYCGHKLTRRSLRERPGFTAILCATDALAFGAFDALREAGKEPGRDVDLVGFDNIESLGIAPFGEPILTTMEKPRYLMGQRAAQMLLEAISCPRPLTEQVELSGKLIQRQSCRFDHAPGKT